MIFYFLDTIRRQFSERTVTCKQRSTEFLGTRVWKGRTTRDIRQAFHRFFQLYNYFFNAQLRIFSLKSKLSGSTSRQDRCHFWLFWTRETSPEWRRFYHCVVSGNLQLFRVKLHPYLCPQRPRSWLPLRRTQSPRSLGQCTADNAAHF